MPTVLLAEADCGLRDTYVRFLSHHGWQVATAVDGLECLAKLRRFVPDFLILDLELPWGGGDGVLGFLRDNPALLPKRVVLTSAVAAPEVLDVLAAPPLIRWLAKPFQVSALLQSEAVVATKEPIGKSSTSRSGGILIVDDEPAVRDLLQTHLRQEGFHVWTAASGEEALDHCCEYGEKIAVVLLDVQMPGLDGPQTLDGIRELDVEIPVCFMTGNPGNHEPADLLRRGARHLFNKPFPLDEVIRVVRHLANEPVGNCK